MKKKKDEKISIVKTVPAGLKSQPLSKVVSQQSASQKSADTNSALQLIKFNHGRIGINFTEKGYVAKVFRKSQAGKLGVCVGWKVLRVNDIPQPRSHFAIISAIKFANNEPFDILFDRSSVNNKNSTDKKVAAESKVVSENMKVEKFVVQFQAAWKQRWGCEVALEEDFSKWIVLDIDSGEQADKLGVLKGDRIVAVNDALLHKDNCEAIKNQLCGGVSCKVAFVRQATSTLPSPCLTNNKGSDHPILEKEEKDVTIQQSIKFQPGRIGLDFNDQGYVTKVVRKSQANRLGVCIGWKIVAVNGIRELGNVKVIIETIKSFKGKVVKLLFDCPEDTYSISSKKSQSIKSKTPVSNKRSLIGESERKLRKRVK